MTSPDPTPGSGRVFRLGIVGHEAAKFTPKTEAAARQVIRGLFDRFAPVACVISGACPLGGVDVWAIEEAKAAGIDTHEFPPMVHEWDGSARGKVGFKQRNIQIAESSDLVVCIVVRVIPPTYRGRHFQGCYHCRDRNPAHVKSGGCWTAWRCRDSEWVIL